MIESNKLFVGNLDRNITRQELKEYFTLDGIAPSHVVITTDRETGKSRGFGFVTFDEADAAKNAMDELNESEINGRTIYIDFAKQRNDAPRDDF